MSFIDVLLGRPLASKEEKRQRVGVFEGLPMLGLDGLASAAYGPEAMLTVLIPLGIAGLSYSLPIIGLILAILFILWLSYRQTIAAYPTGGGSYTVARANLGSLAGLVAAAALMLDYILVVAVGISAGVGALVSAFPNLHPYTLQLGLGLLTFITIINLRGAKESGLALAVPTYLFVVALGGVLLFGLGKAFLSGWQPTPIDPPPTGHLATTPVGLWLLMKAFASGCTAMTGVEAVSNGVTAFAEPTVKNAHRTLAAIVLILASLLLGVVLLAKAYGILATPPGTKSYESIISQVTAAVVGRGFTYYIVIGSTLAVLALSANTGFAGFPRLCKLLAEDDFLPHAFAGLGRRLVYSTGILILATLSGILLIVFGGITDHLIPLFAVGALLSFTLIQAGMVRHWVKHKEGRWKASAAVNGLGTLATGIALLIVLIAKFADGAWITCVLMPFFLVIFIAIRRHYFAIRVETRLRGPIDAQEVLPPLVVVPIKDLSSVTAKALKYAVSLSPDVTAIHVSTNEDEAKAIKSDWTEKLAEPFRQSGFALPELIVLTSPFRKLIEPVSVYVRELLTANPSRLVTVVIPELVEAKWWQYLLHNQRAKWLKSALHGMEERRVVVVNVPWYLEARGAPSRLSARE